jgi:hypothetical protein
MGFMGFMEFMEFMGFMGFMGFMRFMGFLGFMEFMRLRRNGIFPSVWRLQKWFWAVHAAPCNFAELPKMLVPRPVNAA